MVVNMTLDNHSYDNNSEELQMSDAKEKLGSSNNNNKRPATI